MLCDMNSRRATGKTHRASLSTAALGQGVTRGAQRERLGAKPQPRAFSHLHKRLWQLFQEQAGRSHLPIQPEECLCSLLSLSILSEPPRISPDKALYREKEATRVTKKYWFQSPERIKVNKLTADNINLPESKCSLSKEELHSQLYNNPLTLALGT